MCGIVGYIGANDSKEILLNGLEKLEYRGYDSAGIALLNDDGMNVFKVKGRIATLRDKVDRDVSANMGIGHTVGRHMASQMKKMLTHIKVILAVSH